MESVTDSCDPDASGDTFPFFLGGAQFTGVPGAARVTLPTGSPRRKSEDRQEKGTAREHAHRAAWS